MKYRMTLPEFETAVSAEMKKRYGITWEDACGDVEPLIAALAEGRHPAEFVHCFGERYDLQEIAKNW